MRAAGYEVRQNGVDRAGPGDVLLIWNRYGGNHELAARFEKEGGRVLVAENGYLGRGGGTPKFQVHPAGPQPGHYYALSEGWHNGRGRWPAGGPERFEALHVELKPWREQGEYILVAPNRSFGVGEAVMHPDWAERTAARLKRQTSLPIRVRPHPGNDQPKRLLEEDLKGARAVVIWSSSCGVHALADGIPVVCEAPYWVMKEAASNRLDDVMAGRLPERRAAFERMAHAQYTCEEIASGEPFVRLLSPAGKGEVVPHS